MNQGWVYQDRVTSQVAGLTVLEFYTQHYRHSTAADWQERIVTAQITLDGNPTTIATRLQPGQRLAYHRPPWQEPEVPLTFDILHADTDLLAIAKPAGLPVLPGGGFLDNTVLGQLKRLYPTDTPYPIHRLGRGTSGLLLLARSPHARAHLSQQLRDRQLCKTYRALVGSGFPEQLTITQAIGKIPHPTLGYLYGATADGLFAHSECQVLHRTPDTTLLDVTILTGRPHQIRIHLASVGFPLLGDRLYLPGGIPRQTDHRPGDCGYLLHAHRLTLTHPSTHQLLHLLCPAPPALTP